MLDLFKVFMAEEAPAAVAEVLRSGYVGQGPKVDAFERALRTAFDGEQDLLTLNSCTSALDLALHLCGVETRFWFGEGAPIVVTTPMTCSATNSPIVTKGARIAWADVDPRTGLIDPESVERVLITLYQQGKRASAVMVVDWAGRMAEYNRLREVCRRYGGAAPIPIIEDAAHAPLATYNGRYQTHVGGDYICWSFGPIKHISAGSGGALQCPDAETTERARLLRWYGLDRRSRKDFRCEQDITEVGFKYHMSDIDAAIGLANLPHLGHILHSHRGHARFYDKVLKGLPGITLPPWDAGCSWWLYCLLTPRRDEFIDFMAERGIACSQVHRRNDHHTAFKAAEHPASDARPGVEHFAAHQASIPCGWWLDENQLSQVADGVIAWSKRLTQEGCVTQ